MSISSERWSRISALFDELVELAAEPRAERLAAIAAADMTLADELHGLLAADENVSSLLDTDAAAILPGVLNREMDAAPADGMAGSYRLLRMLGEGGMGVVWLGERTDGAYEQQVAVKILKRGMDTNAILRRFLQERRILACLHHPHIVRLVDAGMTADGRPFYVMDHVDGAPITSYARQNVLGVCERVDLLAKVADAVAYAHTQLVVHRDLKPSNVLVDRIGEPRVLDFGIAKLIEESGEQTLTGTGMRVLSPAYAAPEQILGETIGTTTDVYTLGLLLCELLTGELPRRWCITSPAQLALDANSQTVDRASRVAARLDREQLRDVYGEEGGGSQLESHLSGDLDLIIATALQREPSRRYATAAAFSDDLRRWLERRPIAARGDSATYRLSKFVHRHRIGVAASVVIALSLLGGLGAALWQTRLAKAEAQRADIERDNAQRQLARTERVKEFILTLFHEQDPVSRASVQARSPAVLIGDGIALIDSQLAVEPELRAELLRDLGEIQISLDDREAGQMTLRRAWQLQMELSGPDSIATAQSLAAYGAAVYAAGDNEQSLGLLREALKKLGDAGAENTPRAALAESSLALAELVAGNLVEAERLALHALETTRAIAGADSMQVAARLSVLGNIQQENARYADALASYRNALAIVARNNGEDHVRTALLRTCIADVLRLQRKYDEALPHYEAALRIERATLPADHKFIGGTLLRLGDLQRRSGNIIAAEQSIGDAVAIFAGSPTGQYAQALQFHGNLARAQGHFELAAQRQRKSFEVFREATGDSSYTWLTALSVVGSLIELERFAEADALVAEAGAAIAGMTTEDPYTLMYQASVVGVLRQAEGRHDEAIPLLRHALDAVSRIYDEDHADIAQTRVALAASLIAKRDASLRIEASALIETAIDALTRAVDAGSEPYLGIAYLERSQLRINEGDMAGARADIPEAIRRLQSPEYVRRLHQAQAISRKINLRSSESS